MWRLSVRELGYAVHPSGILVEILTKDGLEELVVESSIFSDSSIPVIIRGELHGFAYIELPSDTMRGMKRTWVSKELLRKVEPSPIREVSSRFPMPIRFTTQLNRFASRMGLFE